MNPEAIRVRKGWTNEAETELEAATEAYEGEVAIHLAPVDDEQPVASIYMPPLDAAVYAERISAAARKALADPDYTP